MYGHPNDHYHTILSDSEIKQLLEEYGSADSDRKAVICGTILDMMEPSIEYMVRKRFPTYSEKYGAELMVEGFKAVYEAIPEYDPALEEAPRPYFGKRALTRMQDWLSDKTHPRNSVRFEGLFYSI